MIVGCLVRNEFECKEDRIYKNILIDAHHGEFDHSCEGMAICTINVVESEHGYQPNQVQTYE
jgi:hypothetical protein